jgi:hypothetical protein
MSGNATQRGIIYQELVFLYLILNHSSTDQIFTYECYDDAVSDESVYGGSCESSAYQMKTGSITKEVLMGVFANWMSKDFSRISNFTLYCENEGESLIRDPSFWWL